MYEYTVVVGVLVFIVFVLTESRLSVFFNICKRIERLRDQEKQWALSHIHPPRAKSKATKACHI